MVKIPRDHERRKYAEGMKDLRTPSPSARIHTYLRNAGRIDLYESVIDLHKTLDSRGWKIHETEYELGGLAWLSPLAGPTNVPSQQNDIWLDEIATFDQVAKEPRWALGFPNGAEFMDQPVSEVLARLPELDGQGPASN